MKAFVPYPLIALFLSACGSHDVGPLHSSGRGDSPATVIVFVPKPVPERWFPDVPGVYTRTLPGGIIETAIVEAPRPVK